MALQTKLDYILYRRGYTKVGLLKAEGPLDFRNTFSHRLLKIAATAALAMAAVLLFAPQASADGCTLDNADPTCAYNNGLFLTNTLQPTGTGVIDSFLRVQMKGTEEGFNTDQRQDISSPSGPSAGLCDTTDCDAKTDPNYTRDIQLGDVRTVSYQGKDYYEFFLDVNEQSADPKFWITLDQLEIYASHDESAATMTHTSGNVNTKDGALAGIPTTKVYDLDWGGTSATSADNWINIDYTLSGSGSGKADMVFYLPTSAFAGYDAEDYVYLYSEFGCYGGGSDSTRCAPKNADYSSGYKYKSGAGFEEWWVLGDPSTSGGGGAVPEPGTLILLGTGVAYAARRRFRRQPPTK